MATAVPAMLGGAGAGALTSWLIDQRHDAARVHPRHDVQGDAGAAIADGVGEQGVAALLNAAYGLRAERGHFRAHVDGCRNAVGGDETGFGDDLRSPAALRQAKKAEQFAAAADQHAGGQGDVPWLAALPSSVRDSCLPSSARWRPSPCGSERPPRRWKIRRSDRPRRSWLRSAPAAAARRAGAAASRSTPIPAAWPAPAAYCRTGSESRAVCAARHSAVRRRRRDRSRSGPARWRRR